MAFSTRISMRPCRLPTARSTARWRGRKSPAARYEGMSIDTPMSLLAKHGIETVVDVRELPGNVDGTEYADQQQAPGAKALPQAQSQVAKLPREHFPGERHPQRRTPQHWSAAG